MTVKNFNKRGASLLGKGSSGNIGLGSGGLGLGEGDDIAQPGIAPERDRRDIEDSSENHDADADDIYVFDPDDYSSYHSGDYWDRDAEGGTDTLSLTGVGADEVYVRRGWVHDIRVFIEANDNSFTLEVQVGDADAIERVHFDQNGNGIEDDGDDSILTNDELISAITEDMAIYVDHPDSTSDGFIYRSGDGHQIIGDEDNDNYDLLNIYGWLADEVILTRNNDAPVRDYNTGNAGDPVRTYDDLQLEFPDGKTILLKYVLDGSNRGVDRIWFHFIDITWTKADIMRMARALVTQSSEDQFFHGFAEDDTYIYSQGDGHDTIFEDYHAGNDVLALSGILSSDITVSYSNASDSYIDSYINASDYVAGDIANPDLLLEFGGRGAAANGSVLLALGAVEGYGVESVLFDTNNNGRADDGEVSWTKADMIAAADATAAADNDVYVFNPDDYSSYHWGYYRDRDGDGGTDTLRLTGVGEDEVRVRRGPYIGGDFVFIEANDNSFSLLVPLGGSSGIERVHFDEDGNGIEDGDDSILTNNELLTMIATEDMAIDANHGDDGSIGNQFYYRAGDGHQLINDQDHHAKDYLEITGWSADQVILTRNADAPVRDYSTGNGEDPVRTYDDLQLEFTDGQTILLKYVLEGSDRGVDHIDFGNTRWTKADMIAMARALEDPQSSEDQIFHGLPQDDSYEYSRGDGHDTIIEGDNKDNDVLVLKGGISSSDVTVSYSDAASDYGAGDIANPNPDLLLEFGGRGDAATGSVLLALGAVDGFGIENILFDSNNNGVADAGELLWDKDDMLAAADAIAVADDIYFFDPGDSFYHYGPYPDRANDGGIDTLSLTGVGEHEVRVRRANGGHVYIEGYDNSFTLFVPLSGTNAIERFHFDENGNDIEDDGDDSVLTRDELLTAITENVAIYVNHPSIPADIGDGFFYRAGDGHQIISDQDNGTSDHLVIYGWSADQVTLTRNNDAPVRDYNTGNADAPVRAYDDLQLEFTDGKTILLKHVFEGGGRGVDRISFSSHYYGDYETTWTKTDIIRMARALEDPQSSEDQIFYGFAEDDTYIYSRGSGHDTIFEGDDAGNDVLVLKRGISSNSVIVSYSNASRSYIDASDYGAGDIEHPDLLLEFGGRFAAATGSVLLALGAVDGFGVESVLFDSNNNGIKDGNEVSWTKADMIAAADAAADDNYYFDPGRYFRHRAGYHYDEDEDGGIDTLRLRGIGADEVRVRRGYYGGEDDAVYIDANDNSFATLKVQLGGDDGIERVHFDKNRNSVEDDGDDNILTKDELLSAFTENMAIYVDHSHARGADGADDEFFYHVGDGHQIIGDEDNGDADRLNIYGWFEDEVILTRNNDAPVRDYNTGNADDLVRTYDDLQLEFTEDGKTILLKYVLDGSNRGVDEIYFHGIETTWTKTDMIEMARALVTQSSEDQIFHGFAEDDTYEYSRGDGHDTIFEGDDAGEDVLVLKRGISSNSATVSYSNAGRSYINASDYDAGGIEYPDLLIEFGGRGAAANGSVLLALGAVEGYGVESVLFDSNNNGVADAGELLWDKAAMLAAAESTAATDDIYVFDPDDYSSYHFGYYINLVGNSGIDTLRLIGVGSDEVRLRRGYYGRDDDAMYIEANDNSFTLKVQLQLSGNAGIERVHFDKNRNGRADDGDDNILTNDELFTMIATENMAIYVDHPGGYHDEFFYDAGDGHQIIGDEDNDSGDVLKIYGWTADEVILTRNDDDLVRDYNTGNGEDLVRTYDDLQLEFRDGKTILLKHVLEGSFRGVDHIYFYSGDGVYEDGWTKADIMSRARALVTQSSDDQFFHGFAEDDTYEYSQGDGHDTIFEDDNKGNDVLVLRGISSSDVTVSYSNAGRSYIDASDYGAGDITNPDLLLEFGGIGDEATGSVLLALGAVDGFGIESVLFDENGDGIADAGEVLWDKGDILAAADATAAADLFG